MTESILRVSRGITIPLFLLALQGLAVAQPDKGYHSESYRVTLRLDRSVDSLYGEVLMVGKTLRSLDTILQHARYVTVDSVFLNGSRAELQTIDTASGAYKVIAAAPISSGGRFTLYTYYHGIGMPEQNSYKWGGVTDEDSMMFAMGVGFAISYTSCTRHWLPCYDLPDDKPDSVDLTFITTSRDVTASNGLLVENTVLNGKRLMHWHVSHPIATYLLTFATGPYTTRSVANPLGLPFLVYSLARDSAKTALQMDQRVVRGLVFYDSLFAHYPFEKVGYVVTPIGSMEHQTMISLVNLALDTAYKNTTPTHELAHMWWGDWVTCKTFDDAWLNEGFATFCESLILERFNGHKEYVSKQKDNIQHAITAPYPLFGAPSASHHTDNYPFSTIYQKGAAVLGMLRYYLGDSLFFEGLRHYGRAHAYSTATSHDLESAFESVSGVDLKWFFDEWVFEKGTPKIALIWSPKVSGAAVTFVQTQDHSKYPYFRMPYVVLGSDSSGHTSRRSIWMDSSQTSSTTIDFGFTPSKLVLDPDSLSIKQIASVTLGVSDDVPTPPRIRMNVYPNPTHAGQLNVSLTGLPAEHGTFEFMLCDSRGVSVLTESVNGTASCVETSIDTERIAPGDYLLRASSRYFPAIATKVLVEHR